LLAVLLARGSHLAHHLVILVHRSRLRPAALPACRW
jgi:hypothetical protein